MTARLAPQAPLRLVRDGADAESALNIFAQTATGIPAINFGAKGSQDYTQPIWQIGVDATGFFLYHKDWSTPANSVDYFYATHEAQPRVGIGGVPNPAGQLQITSLKTDRPALFVNNPSSSSVAALQVALNGTVKSSVWNDGSLALGVATQPQELLDVRGKAQVYALKPINQLSSYYTNLGNPHIYAADGGGSYPFDTAGNLIIQPRTSASADIVLANGNTTPTARLVVRGDGNIALFGTTSVAGAAGALVIGSVTTGPSSSPTGAVLLYTQSSLLKMRNPGGATGILTPGHSVKVDTYSASITPDSNTGDYHTIAATNGTAFTINNPQGSTAGQELTFEILNSSGGTMGTITWDTAFKLAGTFTNPANGLRRTITFRYNGSSWIEICRAGADI